MKAEPQTQNVELSTQAVGSDLVKEDMKKDTMTAAMKQDPTAEYKSEAVTAEAMKAQSLKLEIKFEELKQKVQRDLPKLDAAVVQLREVLHRQDFYP